MVLGLIERCRATARAGVGRDGSLGRVLRDEVERLVKEATPRDFLEWIKEDREYSCYYYDARQSSVCAKPAEIMAMILESIALDALE
jgi:hypothetical protein